MNDARRMYGTPMDVLGLEPGKQGRLPMKPPPSEEQIRAYQRSLDEQRRIEGARVLDAADRWAARREQQREIVASEKVAAELRHVQAEAVVSAEVQQEILKQTIESGELRLRSLEAELRFERERVAHGGTAREEAALIETAHALVDAGSTAHPFYRQVITELSDIMLGPEVVRRDVAQSSQALDDTGGANTSVEEASPFHNEVIAELYERMQSPEAKAHPVFRTSERVRRRAEITFTEDEGLDGRAEPRFEHGIHEGRNWSDVAEQSPEYYFATRERLNPGRETERFTAWVDQFYNIQRLLIKKTAIITGPEPDSQPMFRESTSSSSGSPPWLRYVEADEVEGLRTAAEERRAGAPSQVTEEQELSLIHI